MTTTASKHADIQLDVVFVHGLGSDDKAWPNRETKFDWPTKLKCDWRLPVLQTFNAIDRHKPGLSGCDGERGTLAPSTRLIAGHRCTRR
jgi:hypothetical protein